MALRVEHAIHHRRFGRNLGLGVVLAAFVVLVFALTVVKVTQGARPHADDAKKNTGTITQPATGGSQP
jgi:cell division protein FtsI/penicillin-binding protein 2